MPISGWVAFVLICVLIWGMASLGIFLCEFKGRIVSTVIASILTGTVLFGMFWYFGNTADGKRAFIDEKSNFANGLDRVVTVYTADGEVIAQYGGKIDIETNDGGYIKFDFEGKRYIYYNCFVESIAEIE